MRVARLRGAKAEFDQFQADMAGVNDERLAGYTRTSNTLREALDDCRRLLEQARLAVLADPANLPPDVIAHDVRPREVGAMHLDACLKSSLKSSLEGRSYQRVVHCAPRGAFCCLRIHLLNNPKHN